MSVQKEYKYGSDARESMTRVAQDIGKTIGNTLGPAGRNYLIPSGITNDGRTILSHIRYPNECDDSVVFAFDEIAIRTDNDAGDGTTTATTIGTRLLETVLKEVPDLDAPIPGQRSVMDIGRQLEEEKNKALELLESKKVPVETLEQLEKVALTSMEDVESSKIVAETIFKSGANSFTAIDEGFSGKLETDVQSGIEIPVQVAAPFMFNKGKSAEYESVPVLVVNHLFEEYRELTPFLQSYLEHSKNHNMSVPAIVIVAKQFSIPFVQAVSRVYNGSKGAVNILLLANQHLSDDLFEDVSAFTDAQYIDTHPKGTHKITEARFSDCGFVSKIVATPKGAVMYGGRGATLADGPSTRVASRIMEIEKEIKEEKNKDKRKVLENRIAEFNGGKATIYVDAKTAAEKYYLKLKVEDGMNSCKAALEGGMVRGGGLTLKEIAEELGEDSLLAEALLAPYRRIQENAGGSLEIGEDVFDSLLVAKAGIANAVSVIKTLVTTEGIIANKDISMVEELQKALTE